MQVTMGHLHFQIDKHESNLPSAFETQITDQSKLSTFQDKCKLTQAICLVKKIKHRSSTKIHVLVTNPMDLYQKL